MLTAGSTGINWRYKKGTFTKKNNISLQSNKAMRILYLVYHLWAWQVYVNILTLLISQFQSGITNDVGTKYLPLNHEDYYHQIIDIYECIVNHQSIYEM